MNETDCLPPRSRPETKPEQSLLVTDNRGFKMIALTVTAILAICAGTLIALASSEFGPELGLAVVSLV
ncbi:hypothetical protein JQ620_34320 [Bradyrhizobium sp. AUGA SZCCT0274]|uniref:hypothetical protein n=1 Tax=Bradyrhizobium sp. AUGA SZCCT0274 TaxID=2807670 RepID=UPI001BAB6FDD|nr:hypothetical protein [Bradyrhizobium sp. AUGA SZCCT0274]MBR1245169.1 hypothetical protein [Bradyrhizobium sp. AUGA SZCCT0274]